MRAGQLRHRIIIHENSPIQDTDGTEIDNWVTFATVWAAVEEMSGREAFDTFGKQELAKKSVRIRIRYRSGVTHKMRVSWGTRLFDIQEVNNMENRLKEIHLMCEEVPGGES